METKIKHTKEQLAALESVKRFIKCALNEELSFALWKYPHSKNTHLVIGDTSKFKTDELNKDQKGFIFHPYNQFEQGYRINPHFLADYTHQLEIINDVNNLEDKVSSESYTHSVPFYSGKNLRSYQTDSDSFEDYVTKGIQEIKNGTFQKVVPSRSKEIVLDDKFDPLDIFERLGKSYPNAFISLVSIPEVGTWLGATPELLVEVKDDYQFKTVALAGTQKYDASASLSSVAWTQKEIEEQAMVSRYIINCFKKIRLREFEEIGPKTVVAGNLIHLKTTFEVDMQATNFPELDSVMIDLLHPTSAICGMPQEIADDFIHKHEGDKRGYFSGYLGPWNIQNRTGIYVNLRCMQIGSQSAILYAGAGLTEDSDPEKEWKETELKMNTLLNVINQED